MVIRASVLLALMAQPVLAQPVAPRLALELNTAEQTDDACRISFLAENTLGVDLAALVFEVVVLNAQGHVDRLTLLDFQDLPQGRKRVRQFDLPGLPCDELGQLLVNAASSCTGEGLDHSACMNGLAVTSRVAGTEIAG